MIDVATRLTEVRRRVLEHVPDSNFRQLRLAPMTQEQPTGAIAALDPLPDPLLECATILETATTHIEMKEGVVMTEPTPETDHSPLPDPVDTLHQATEMADPLPEIVLQDQSDQVTANLRYSLLTRAWSG